LDGELAGQFAAAENLDGVATAIDEALLAQRLLIDGGAVIEGVEVADVDDFIDVAEHGVAEALLGKSAMQRHLAAFKAGADALAGAGLLALVALAGSLAVTGAFAAADALAALLRTRAGLNVVKSHEM